MVANAVIVTPSGNINHQPSPSVASRREMLTFGGTAAAVAGLMATAPAVPDVATIVDHGADAEIIRLADAVMDGHAMSRRLSDEVETAPSRARQAEIDKQQRAITEAGWDMRQQLVTMPATTLAGFRAKACVVREFNGCSDGYATGHEDDALAWSLASDLLGLPCILKEGAGDQPWSPIEMSISDDPPLVWQPAAGNLQDHLTQASADYSLLETCEDLQNQTHAELEQKWRDTPDEYAALEAQLAALQVRGEADLKAIWDQRIRLAGGRVQASAAPGRDGKA